MGRCSFFTRIILIGVLAFVGGVGCQLYERNVPQASVAPLLPGQSNAIFTTARPSFGAAFNDFLNRRPEPVQRSRPAAPRSFRRRALAPVA